MDCCNKIAIYGSRRQPEALGELPRLFNFLASLGFRIFIQDKFAEYLAQNNVDMLDSVPAEHIPPGVGMVMSLGGDGTFLRTARWIGKREIPIIGINTGHLGFLSSGSLDDAQDLILSVCRGEILVEKRMLIQVASENLPTEKWPYALNEIALMRHGSSMLQVRAEINGDFLADYTGDGLIVATPTGSTAYSLSAGGPIIQPTIDCMCLCPVAPHTLTLRPLVAGGDSEIRLIPKSRAANFILSIDDQSLVLPADGAYTIRKAPFSVLLIRKKEDGFASILRKKLLWSASSRH